MIDLIAYIVVRSLNIISNFIPVSLALWFGRRIGTLVFIINKKRRVIAYANLKAAFSKEKSPAELRGITKRVYQNMVQTFVEVLHLTKVNRKYVDQYVEILDLERIQNASKSGRGTILLTAHFGDWELLSLVSSVVGFPILVLAREQKMKRLNGLLDRLRESNGCKVVRKGMQTKNLLRALRRNDIVGILSDQDAGKKGMFVEFFGRPTSCHSGPFEIAKHTGSLILPNLIVRTGGPYHKVFLEEYIDFKKTESPDDIRENLQKFTTILESYIRKYPDQWLWLHKRWKSTPVRSILILSDGKAGHINQSMAIARQIQKARISQGYKSEETKIEVIDVKFKSKASRAALDACAAFASWRCHGCMRCMRFLLERSSYDALMKTYCDFVISCGSSLSAVNIFMAKENNAKNIVVMKPNLLGGAKKFSLAVIPSHDDPSKAGNIVETALAPNLMSEEKLKSDGLKLKAKLNGVFGDAVGLFIGGDNPEFSLTKDIVDGLLDSLLKFCEKHRTYLLVTTSRRTSPEIENVLKARLKDNPLCKLLVIANENNFDEAVAGILNLSRVNVISEESVSMISEAVTAGKPVIVFKLDKKTKNPTKHEKLVSGLKDAGYIAVTEAGVMSGTLKSVWDNKVAAKKPDDETKIFEAVKRLL